MIGATVAVAEKVVQLPSQLPSLVVHGGTLLFMKLRLFYSIN